MMKKKKNRFSFRSCLMAVVLAGLTGCLAIIAIGLLLQRPAVERRSVYIPMRDGVRIAVDVWLPAGLPEGETLPVILRATRYWRGYEVEAWFEPVAALTGRDLQLEAKNWTGAGYALVAMDVRGSGASEGDWNMWSEREIADMGEVVDWIVAQPWSSGRVGAYGVSYDGNTAELLTALHHPAVKAVAPQFSDFDAYGHLVFPGGVYNDWFMRAWNTFNRMLDANDVCALAFVTNADCSGMEQVMYGAKRVDKDPDGAQLMEVVAARSNPDVYLGSQTISFRDDPWGPKGEPIDAMSPFTWREAIEGSNVPMYVWVSWLDSASVEGALARYRTFSNPQSVIIGPWNHSASGHADPFLAPNMAVEPSPEEQFRMLAVFFDRYLKDGGEPIVPEIRYYTLGEGVWKSTTIWPPDGFTRSAWYFAADGVLAEKPPGSLEGEDRFLVDWQAATGAFTRWHTGLAMADVIYPDRRDADARLLAYTSAPLARDLEITGNAVLTLFVQSSAADGAFFAYLEDVAPDGKVTYITEGQLRAIHRQIAEGEPLYETDLPFHSYLRADALPLVPDEVAELQIGLYATSVLIRAGHSIRVALAGHDASVFARYPAEGEVDWVVMRNAVYMSRIDLPMRAR